MKKFISVMIALMFMLYSSPMIVNAASDVTPPTITGMTVSQLEAKPGDTIKFEVQAVDSESGVSDNSVYSNSIWLQNSVNGDRLICAGLYYNESTGKYEGQYTIPSTMKDGVYSAGLYLYDKAGNMTTYYSNSSLSISGGVNDVTPPTVTDMTVSQTEAKPGDTIKFEVAAGDSESGVSDNSVYSNSIWLQNSVNGDRIICAGLYYNESTGKYEGQYTIPSTMKDGVYSAGLYLYDKAGNMATYYSSISLSISGGVNDVTPPTVTDMTVSQAEVKQGDTIKFEIDASDSGTGVSDNSVYSNSIWLQNSVNGDRLICAGLSYNESTGKYEGQYKLPSTMADGEYSAGVYLYDKAGNMTTYYSGISVKIVSIFSGTENETVNKGEIFNPVEGVTAQSNFEGDITDKIAHSGTVDTNSVGLYLIRYSVTGKNGDIYRDYRWITVVDNSGNCTTDSSGGTYFNEPIHIGAGTSEQGMIDVKKDGTDVNLSGTDILSEEGTYDISLSEVEVPASVVSYTSQRIVKYMAAPGINSGTPSGSIRITIDKTVPVISGIEDNITYSKSVIPAVSDLNLKDVTIEKDGRTFSWTNGQTIVQEGKYDIFTMDKAGNSTKLSFKIDKTGDADNDGVIDVRDLAWISRCYGAVESNNTSWQASSDLNKDGIIDIYDLVVVSEKLQRLP